MIGYFVVDRPDCQFAAEDVVDTEEAGLARRLAKFLASHHEVECIMLVQDGPEKYVVFGDSKWGGYESRRSTSGIFAQLGSHSIDFSCSTQHVITLSSGLAALYATGRVAVGGPQSVQLLAEASLKLELEVFTESNSEYRHAQPYRIRTSTTSRRAMALDAGSCPGGVMLAEESRHLERWRPATKYHDEERPGSFDANACVGCDLPEDFTSQRSRQHQQSV